MYKNCLINYFALRSCAATHACSAFPPGNAFAARLALHNTGYEFLIKHTARILFIYIKIVNRLEIEVCAPCVQADVSPNEISCRGGKNILFAAPAVERRR